MLIACPHTARAREGEEHNSGGRFLVRSAHAHRRTSPSLLSPSPSHSTINNRWAEPGADAASAPAARGASALHTLGIYVNSNFDAGNADVVSVGSRLVRGVPHEVDLRIVPDPYCDRDGRSHFQWFYFRVSGAKGERLR